MPMSMAGADSNVASYVTSSLCYSFIWFSSFWFPSLGFAVQTLDSQVFVFLANVYANSVVVLSFESTGPAFVSSHALNFA